MVAEMANASKRKGSGWESACAAYLAENGVPWAERRVVNGSKDRGDLAGVPGVVFECKAEARVDLPGYLREAEAERVNDKADLGVVWIKARGRTSAGAGYVVMTPATLLYLLRAAGYVKGGEGA